MKIHGVWNVTQKFVSTNTDGISKDLVTGKATLCPVSCTSDKKKAIIATTIVVMLITATRMKNDVIIMQI